jgi:hypothetical protein
VVGRAELSGWVQVVIGLVGLYFTVTQGGPALEAISAVGAGRALPPEFTGIHGGIRVFLFLLTLVTTLAFLLIGLGIVLGAVFRHVGAKMPLHGAYAVISAIVLLCASLSFAIFDILLWPITSLLALLCVVLSCIAGIDDEGEFFYIVLIGGVAGSMFVGIAASAIMGSPRALPSEVTAKSAADMNQRAAVAAATSAR